MRERDVRARQRVREREGESGREGVRERSREKEKEEETGGTLEAKSKLFFARATVSWARVGLSSTGAP